MAKAVSKQELKKSKDVATLLLKAQGVNYDDWLHGQHQEIEKNNQDVVEKALELFINQKAQ
ncbi:hypothetical protein IHV12_19615 [Fictibacillus sp. 7GRE50]|uniref:hypothetical protein n=1 Tax=Fictibacillus sp. 7GRE50 TaxID=2745878 RepID=UPI0018CDAD97|nr:hypothetical protein [Fictibacillus sp. 7GRE50]MBH0167136.1 hypothetical protein [Fictibacillus sp. 7GRE50]